MKDWRTRKRGYQPPFFKQEWFVTVLNKEDNSITIYKMQKNILESLQLQPELVLEKLGCKSYECEFMVSKTKPYCSNMTDADFEFSNDAKI